MTELRLDKTSADHNTGRTPEMNLFTPFGSNNFGSIFSEIGNYNGHENQRPVCFYQ